MSSSFKPASWACLALALFAFTISLKSAGAAGIDDHSYLPPWMLDRSTTTQSAGDKVIAANVPVNASSAPLVQRASTAQQVTNITPAKPQAQPAKKAIVSFVSRVFIRTIRFATGG